MYVNASSLNVRTEPSTTAGKAQSLSRGTAVQVNGLSGDWARISLGGKNYYVSSRYLSSGNSAAPHDNGGKYAGLRSGGRHGQRYHGQR